MATLADELMEDFMDSGSEGGGEEAEKTESNNGANGHLNGDQELESDAEDDNADGDEDAVSRGRNAVADAEDETEAKARIEKIDFSAVGDVRSVASLMKQLKPVVEKIEHYQNTPAQKQYGPMEDNPEYKLLTQANAFSSSIDGEIILVHKFLRDHYSIRYPEMEKLIESPLAYAKAVRILGNNPFDDLKALTPELEKILPRALVMSVRMEATTTKGVLLSEAQLKTVMAACTMVEQLDHAKKILGEYVQSRMNIFAPNLTVLLGAETGTKLLQAAGGLAALAKIPSCNIANVGWKNTKTGFATNIGVRQKGHLYYSNIVQNVPTDFRQQALRIVAAKVVLAARVDATLKTHDTSVGVKLREEVATRLQKISDAAPNKGPRALPDPSDRPATKRGGRLARAMKAKYALTDLQKQQNRMVFGKEEAEVGYGVGDSTKGMGMIGQQNDGRIRGTAIDKRTAARLSKKNPGWGGSGLASSIHGFGQGGGTVTGLRTAGVGTGGGGGGGGGGGAGTSSVIAFTPFQGLELADPRNKDANERKRKAEEDRYFRSGTFTSVGGGSSMVPQEPKVDTGGFKVPALPALKRVKKC